jgi:uncharacterized protein YggU (UPF0235/DUF167 family)
MSLIHVKAFPDAPHEHFEENEKGTYRIFVREPAQDNRANKRITFLVAQHLQIEPSLVRMIRGHKGTSKLLEIRDGK